MSVAVKRNCRFHLKFSNWWFKNRGGRILKPLSFQGYFRLNAVAAARTAAKQKMGEQFTNPIANHLLSLSHEKLRDIYKQDEKKNMDSGLAVSDVTMIMDSEFASTTNQEKAAPLLVTINNEKIILPQ